MSRTRQQIVIQAEGHKYLAVIVVSAASPVEMAIIRVNSQRASGLAHYAMPAFSEICAANSEIAVFVLEEEEEE